MKWKTPHGTSKNEFRVDFEKVNYKTTKLLEENRRVSLWTWVREYYILQQDTERKRKVDKFDFKILNLCDWNQVKNLLE